GHESRDNYPSTARLDVSFCPVSWPFPFPENRQSKIANQKSLPSAFSSIENQKSKDAWPLSGKSQIANRAGNLSFNRKSKIANRKFRYDNSNHRHSGSPRS